jgi:rod shape-determining protein MreD
VRRAVLSVIVLAVALMLQLTFVNRLPLPGGSDGGGPDLVLLAVVALALQATPAVGAVTGFCAGLALDLAPPGSYLIGEYALVFCLVGYLCGRLRPLTGNSAVLTILAAMAAAAAGESLSALLGRVLSDPQVTWAAVRSVLPGAVIYDVALAPFVLFGVMRAMNWAEGLFRVADGGMMLASAHAPGGVGPGATTLGGAGLLGGAGWLSGPPPRSRALRKAATRHPHTPRLRGAAARPGDGWVGGGGRGRAAHPARPRAARPPRLRSGPGPAARRMAGSAGLSGGPARPGGWHPGSAAARSPRFRPARQPTMRSAARRHRDGAIGRAVGSPGGVAGGRASMPGSAFRGHGPSAVGPGNRPAIPRPGRRRDRRRGRAGRSFRPNPRLRGGSSIAPAAAGRMPPSRRITLHLGSSRRHDGVLGGRSSGRPAGGMRGLTSRSFSLHLGSPRRRDGTLGGLARQRKLWARRRAVPRFRSGPSLGRRSALGGHGLGGQGLTGRKRARFFSGGGSFLKFWTGGRLGSRSAAWRIGSKRTGGF